MPLNKETKPNLRIVDSILTECPIVLLLLTWAELMMPLA